MCVCVYGVGGKIPKSKLSTIGGHYVTLSEIEKSRTNSISVFFGYSREEKTVERVENAVNLGVRQSQGHFVFQLCVPVPK